MRILVVSDSFPPVPSGVSKYAFYLTKKLLELGFQVNVLTGGVSQKVKEDIEIKRKGGNVFRVGKLISVTANGTKCFITLISPSSVRTIKNVMRKGYDAVILQGPLGLTLPYPVTLLSGKSMMVGVFHSVTDKPNLGYILFRGFMKPFLRALDVKIAVSRWAKAEIEKYFGPQDMEIIPPGVDTKFYSPSKGKKKKDEIRILFVGRLDERKGVDVLCNVWNGTEKFGVKNGKKVPARLIIAGDGPMRKKIEVRVKGAEFLGFVPEEKLPELYASSDFSVFPAKGGESFGIVLIEAMSSGSPPLASKIKGYSDVVEHGKNGLLFDGEEDMRSKIIALMRDEELRKKIRVFAREHVIKKYSWDKVARSISEVIRKQKLL